MKKRDGYTADDVKTLYLEVINPDAQKFTLEHVVDDLIDSGISADYLCFAIHCAADGIVRLTSPYGLKYIINYEEVRSRWRSKQNENALMQVLQAQDKMPPSPVLRTGTDKYTVPNPFRFGSVLD